MSLSISFISLYKEMYYAEWANAIMEAKKTHDVLCISRRSGSVVLKREGPMEGVLT